MLIDFLILILADRLALVRHFLLRYIQRTLVSPPGVVVGWLTINARAGPGGGIWLLQYLGVLGRQCEVVWEDDVCLSERCRSCQIVGAITTEVASC